MVDLIPFNITRAKEGDQEMAFSILKDIALSLKTKDGLRDEYRDYLSDCLERFTGSFEKYETYEKMEGAFARSFHLLGPKGRAKSDFYRDLQIAEFVHDLICKGEKLEVAILICCNSGLIKEWRGGTSKANIKRIYYDHKEYFELRDKAACPANAAVTFTSDLS